MAKCREKLKTFGRITFLASQKYRFTVAQKKLTNLNFCSHHDIDVSVLNTWNKSDFTVNISSIDEVCKQNKSKKRS